jgi:hypothetical protein
MKTILTLTITISAFIFNGAAFAASAPHAAAPVVNPGIYAVSNGVMKGTFELHEDKGLYAAHINLVQPDSGHLADFKGPAIIAGNKITVTSTEGDGARITIRMVNGVAVMKANTAADDYHGMRATFNGTYDYKRIK